RPTLPFQPIPPPTRSTGQTTFILSYTLTHTAANRKGLTSQDREKDEGNELQHLKMQKRVEVTGDRHKTFKNSVIRRLHGENAFRNTTHGEFRTQYSLVPEESRLQK
ncbi:glycoside hydrolase family 10 protein, partial [Moniliophthora roreri]